MRTVLRGSTVVDGSGGPAREADVEVVDGRISRIGEIPAERDLPEEDLSGLVLAPGFIDLHTHYDAQLMWEPTLEYSLRHGVTSVVIGNCGLTLAPCRPTDRDYIIDLFSVVEGMRLEDLEKGLQWGFESVPEYLRQVEVQPLELNVGMLVGHQAVRRYVLGAEAASRPASPEEIATMAAIVRDGVEHGALGFSTDWAGSHIDSHGDPVPSMAATQEEIDALAAAMHAGGGSFFEMSCGRDFRLDKLLEMSRATGMRISPTAILTGHSSPAEIEAILAAVAGTTIHPQITCRKRMHYLTLATPVEFVRMSETFRGVLGLSTAELSARYADPAWRDTLRSTLLERGQSFLATCQLVESAVLTDLLGERLVDIAAAQGKDLLDALFDLTALDLAARFAYPIFNDDEDGVARLLADRHTVLGLSDAGAHSDRLFDANFPTDLLGYWVRDAGRITLEDAVWRLTGQPAGLLGLEDRGRIAEGAAADLVAFDPDRVGYLPLQRLHDLPAGGERLVSRSVGIEGVWVNGAKVFDHDAVHHVGGGTLLG